MSTVKRIAVNGIEQPNAIIPLSDDRPTSSGRSGVGVSATIDLLYAATVSELLRGLCRVNLAEVSSEGDSLSAEIRVPISRRDKNFRRDEFLA